MSLEWNRDGVMHSESGDNDDGDDRLWKVFGKFIPETSCSYIGLLLRLLRILIVYRDANFNSLVNRSWSWFIFSTTVMVVGNW